MSQQQQQQRYSATDDDGGTPPACTPRRGCSDSSSAYTTPPTSAPAKLAGGTRSQLTVQSALTPDGVNHHILTPQSGDTNASFTISPVRYARA